MDRRRLEKGPSRSCSLQTSFRSLWEPSNLAGCVKSRLRRTLAAIAVARQQGALRPHRFETASRHRSRSWPRFKAMSPQTQGKAANARRELLGTPELDFAQALGPVITALLTPCLEHYPEAFPPGCFTLSCLGSLPHMQIQRVNSLRLNHSSTMLQRNCLCGASMA